MQRNFSQLIIFSFLLLAQSAIAQTIPQNSSLKNSTELPSNPQHPMYGLNNYVPAYDINYATNTNWYGSGDVNGDGVIDMADYNSSITGTNPFKDGTHRGDTDLNGISGQPADKAIILEYINGTRTHINMWELETIAEKRNHLAKAIAIDKTDEVPYNASGGWTCGNYSAQTFFNFNGVYQIENTIFSGDNNTNLQYDISHNGIFRIPLREVSTWAGSGVAHSIINVYLGSPENQDATAFSNRIYIEPQTDAIVAPGNYSFNQTAYETWYGYYYNNLFSEWRYGSNDIIRYDITKTPQKMIWKHPSLVLSWNPFQEVQFPSDKEVEYFQGIENNYATLSGELVGKYPGTIVNKTISSTQIIDGSDKQYNFDVSIEWELIAGAYNTQNTANANHTQMIYIRSSGLGLADLDFPSLSIQCVSPVENTGKIFIKAVKPQHLEVGIYDISGRFLNTIYRGQISGETNIEYSVDAYKKGIYLLKFNAKDEKANTASFKKSVYKILVY